MKRNTMLIVRRVAKGKTQKEVCHALGLNESTLSKYELGHATPSFRTACKIADYYGITLEQMRSDFGL